MGSLMAGWNSHVSDPKTVIYERNKSYTREEIEAYWKTKEEEHQKDNSSSPRSSQESEYEEPRKFQRSISLPLNDQRGSYLTVDAETALEKLKRDWWTRTNWAFLNEPPVINTEGPSHKYMSQYHVTNRYSSKQDDHAGISA